MTHLHETAVRPVSQVSGLGAAVHIAARVWRHWKARSRVRSLADFDDRMLADIGVTRDEVAWASRLPLSVNAALALGDQARLRRAGSRPRR